MARAHVFISGFVQGVGFRHFVKREALKLGLKGWVRNLPVSPTSGLGGPDNRVEGMFQGEKEKVEELIKECKKGPFLSEVEEVEVLWEPEDKELESFDIVI